MSYLEEELLWQMGMDARSIAAAARTPPIIAPVTPGVTLLSGEKQTGDRSFGAQLSERNRRGLTSSP